MRKLILQMMMSLDGFVSGEKDELDWIDTDPTLGEAHYKLAKGADAAIMGHEVYKDMADFWPEVAKTPGVPEATFAKLMNEMKKYVVSTKQETLAWSNSEQLVVESSDDLVKKITAMKNQDGRYLIVYGGVQTAQTLVKHGLVDEFYLDICPVVLGAGKKLFDTRTEFSFVSATPYRSGAMTVVYRPKVADDTKIIPAPKIPASGDSVEFGSWAKILVVEDNAALADIYKTHMEMIGYICFVAHEGNEALAMIEKERPSLVLLDLMVPGVAGDQILRRMRASEWGQNIKVLVISNLNEADAPAGLRSEGIEGYAVKANLTDDQLDQMVNDILKRADKASAPAKPAAK